MTPQEAIKNIDDILDSPYLCDESIDYQLTTDDIECLEMAKEALEKQIPKKPKTLNYGLLIEYGWKYGCPNCGCAIGDNKNLAFAYGEYLEPYEDYCCNCGQALDWSDTE